MYRDFRVIKSRKSRAGVYFLYIAWTHCPICFQWHACYTDFGHEVPPDLSYNAHQIPKYCLQFLVLCDADIPQLYDQALPEATVSIGKDARNNELLF